LEVNNPNNHSKGLIAWFANNHVAANILMIFLVIAGLATLTSMRKETFPLVDPKMITISVAYPGATPQDVEDGITRRAEEAVIGIQGIKRVQSQAMEGYGLVTAELEDFVDGGEVLNDVETAINSLNNFPPENAEEVNIVRSKLTAAVLTLVVHGELPESSLRDWAERVEDEILQLPSVALVDISGSRNREITIEVSEDNLRKYQLTINDIASAIREFSVDLPAGTLKTKNSEILVRVQERKYYGKDFANIVIKSKSDGSILRLSQIAKISDGFDDGEIVNLYNGKPAIFVNVKRSETQDSLKIEQEVHDYLQNLALPEAVNVSIWRNETDILRDRMNLLTRNAIMGFTLVFLALLLFLDLKLAFWTSLGIPISFLGGIFVASMLGVTLNMVTLFGLIVVLGIVVDDAIVAGESIFSEQEKGKKNLNATLDGVFKIRAPVTIGVLTTVAAFAPLLFSTGTLGQILRPIPIIVITILLISLFEAFFILPTHLATSKRWSIGLLADIRHSVTAKLERFINKRVLPSVKFSIRHRYLTMLACFAIVLCAVFMLKTGMVRFVFFPSIESDQVQATLEMNTGTPFETTAKYTENIIAAAEKLRKEYDEDMPEGTSIFKNISVTIGSMEQDGRGPGVTSRSSNSGNLAQIQIELVPSNDRNVRASEIERKWQEYSGDIPGVKKLAFESSLIRGGEDINIELVHRNDATLKKAAADLKKEMKNIEGVSEVTDSAEYGKREFVYEVTNTGLAAGISAFDIGRQLRDYLYGREVDRIQRGRNEVKVMVRYPKQTRETLATMNDIRIQLPNGKSADLNSVAKMEERRSLSTIKRVDGRRVVSVTGDADEKIITPNEANDMITQEIIPELQKKYPGLNYSLEGKSRDQQDDMKALGRNMLIALMLIFVMLAGQLKSYAKPFIIILTIPIGITGAIFGHFLLGFDLSFISTFGIVALMGVVINDSVVLVDYFNSVVEQGEKFENAALQAVERRFRPILLTTLTTALGLLPILMETSLQAQFLIPMAVSLACGIVFASSILIFMIPSLLVILEDFHRLTMRFSGNQDERQA